MRAAVLAQQIAAREAARHHLRPRGLAFARAGAKHETDPRVRFQLDELRALDLQVDERPERDQQPANVPQADPVRREDEREQDLPRSNRQAAQRGKLLRPQPLIDEDQHHHAADESGGEIEHQPGPVRLRLHRERTPDQRERNQQQNRVEAERRLIRRSGNNLRVRLPLFGELGHEIWWRFGAGSSGIVQPCSGCC
jgi:hypothetical protein